MHATRASAAWRRGRAQAEQRHRRHSTDDVRSCATAAQEHFVDVFRNVNAACARPARLRCFWCAPALYSLSERVIAAMEDSVEERREQDGRIWRISRHVRVRAPDITRGRHDRSRPNGPTRANLRSSQRAAGLHAKRRSGRGGGRSRTGYQQRDRHDADPEPRLGDGRSHRRPYSRPTITYRPAERACLMSIIIDAAAHQWRWWCRCQ